MKTNHVETVNEAIRIVRIHTGHKDLVTRLEDVKAILGEPFPPGVDTRLEASVLRVLEAHGYNVQYIQSSTNHDGELVFRVKANDNGGA